MFALKVLPRGPELDEVFVAREVAIQSRLRHVNIVMLHEARQRGGTCLVSSHRLTEFPGHVTVL